MKDGRISDIFYGHLAAFAIDPVEKKPLYHFLPGTKTVSICMQGCCLDCDFCQNWTVARSFSSPAGFLPPEDVAGFARSEGYPSISYTYTEPLVWQDYMLDCQEAASSYGIKGIMVTNGYFSKEAREAVIPRLDAFNIDLKGDSAFYRAVCHGEDRVVLDAIEAVVLQGKHLEVTTLLIEGIHDRAMVRSLGRSLRERGVKVWHLSRFFPARRMRDRPPTSEDFLEEMLETARESGIPHIYPGNSRMKTPITCPECGRETSDGLCNHCRVNIYGVWTTTG